MLQFTFSYYFTFERKYLKIIAFSKRDGLKMNGSSIGLEKKKKMQNAVIALKCYQYGRGCFNVTYEG